MIHGPKETKARWSQPVITLYRLQNQRGNQRVLRSLFPRPNVSTVLLFAIFLHVAVQQHVGQDADPGQRRKAVIRDTSGVDHRAVTILSAPIWFTGRRHCTFFVTWGYYRCRFCVRKAFWRWFYPRSRKRNHFQTLATGVPELKTLLGTQRVNTFPGISQNLPENVSIFFAKMIDLCLLTQKNQTL